MSDRLDVRKTYKNVVNGAFVRSESQRTYEVTAADGSFLANVALSTRKDVRDAVTAARAAQHAWWASTAYNRGQVLYRWAEMADARREELAREVALVEGLAPADALAVTAAAIDRIVWYAGWTDKVAQVFGGANPVAGPFFNFSVPTPTGVVGVVADRSDSLATVVEAVLAPLATGNAVVAIASEVRPTPALLLAEISATSDLPPGLFNLLTGRRSELAGPLAGHGEVDGLDLSALDDDEAGPLAEAAAATITRVLRHGDREPTRRLRAFIETATIWHTVGQ